MKTYYTLFLTLLLASSVMAQNKTSKQDSLIAPKNGKLQKLESFKSDTLGFIKENFCNQKAAYLHKPLSDLLADIQLPVITYIIVSGPKPIPAECIAIVLHFENPIAEERKVSRKVEPLMLIITWDVPLPLSEVDVLMKKNNYMWTKEVQNYFSKQVVGDIGMRNWRFKKQQ